MSSEETKTEMVDEKVQVTNSVSDDVKGKEEEPFDKERAMKTIESLREIEKEKKKMEKELAALREEKAKREQAEMTELEKAQKRVADLEAKLKASEMRELRRSAAEKVGLPIAFAERLKGETPEELEEDAKAFLEALPKSQKQTTSISATNPAGAAKPVESEAEKRSRIFGINPDPWGGSKPVEVKD